MITVTVHYPKMIWKHAYMFAFNVPESGTFNINYHHVGSALENFKLHIPYQRIKNDNCANFRQHS